VKNKLSRYNQKPTQDLMRLRRFKSKISFDQPIIEIKNLLKGQEIRSRGLTFVNAHSPAQPRRRQSDHMSPEKQRNDHFLMS